MKKSLDWVSPLISMAMIINLHNSHFMLYKKMRIVGTEHLTVAESLHNGQGWLLILTMILLVLSLLKLKWPRFRTVISLGSSVAIAALFFFGNHAHPAGLLEMPHSARVSLGTGMWFSILGYSALLILSNVEEKNPWVKTILATMPLVLIGLLFMGGYLEGHGIVKEYHTYHERFIKAVGEHVQISLWVVLFAQLLGVLLGYASYKEYPLGKLGVALVNTAEVLPALSLITLIMIPLAAVGSYFPELIKHGIGAYGITAPFVALVLYGIFPIAHSTDAALKTIDPQWIETGSALGMSPLQIFFKVRIPLALPILLSGFRIALVQTIAGTTLAAFVGGGGLGTFVLQTESMDFVLLGTLPIIGMTFFCDGAIKFLINSISPKGKISI